MQLNDLGWDSFFQDHFDPFRLQGHIPMRIIRENRGLYLLSGETVECFGEVSGKFRFQTDGKSRFPAVGDWAAVSALVQSGKTVIHAVLPRKSVFSRKVAGELTEEQVVAANIDTVFIVTGLDSNYNLRRIERYLTMAWNSGATPVVLLNKSDLCSDGAESRKLEVETVAIGVDVLALSAAQGEGLNRLSPYLKPGKTIAFIGSSGAGKSTIINALLGTERQKTGEVSELGSRGRHTTTSRELLMLPDGGMVIDTPGMRELQVWGDEEGLKAVFEDIEELGKNCRFRDCSHVSEPGCGVLEALKNGLLDPKRLENYYKLKKEFSYLSDRQNMTASAVEKARNRQISKMIKKYFQEDGFPSE